MTAGLAYKPALRFDGYGDRLFVGYLRLTNLGADVKFAG